MRVPRRLLTVLLPLGVLAFAAASISLPFAGFQGETFVDIPKGVGTFGMARMLAEARVVDSSWQFLAVRALRPRARLQAGEYRFSGPSSVWRVFDRIARGDVFYYELAVPEGQNMFDIAASLERLQIIGASAFLKAARDPSPIRDIAPEAPTLEGYLFPDTYRITRGTTAAQLCRQMTDRFREAWEELGRPSNVHEMVTLASLVEKETAVAEERPVVASVFRNRLRLNMRLECDPTAIYSALLENRYDGEIRRSDLESTNRYNTYQHGGLPPGPIANPGLESLRAAQRPAATPYLYFVARPGDSGTHVFSTELEAHHRAVARYRRGTHQVAKKQSARSLAR